MLLWLWLCLWLWLWLRGALPPQSAQLLLLLLLCHASVDQLPALRTDFGLQIAHLPPPQPALLVHKTTKIQSA